MRRGRRRRWEREHIKLAAFAGPLEPFKKGGCVCVRDIDRQWHPSLGSSRERGWIVLDERVIDSFKLS